MHYLCYIFHVQFYQPSTFLSHPLPLSLSLSAHADFPYRPPFSPDLGTMHYSQQAGGDSTCGSMQILSAPHTGDYIRLMLHLGSPITGLWGITFTTVYMY